MNDDTGIDKSDATEVLELGKLAESGMATSLLSEITLIYAISYSLTF